MIETDRVVWLSNKFPEWSSLQRRDSYQRRHLCYRVRAFVFLLYLGYEQIRDYRHPEVCTDSIFGVSPHGLDNNVLLNPFEEDLYIPSVPVQVSDLQCADVEVVGDEYDLIASLVIVAAYRSYRFWIQRHCIRLCQTDDEIACDASLLVCFSQNPVADDLILHIRLRPANPIGTSKMETKQCVKVHISSVHHVEGRSLWGEQIKFVTVMPSAVRYMNIGRDASTQCKQSVHLDGSFAVLAQSPCGQLDAGGDGSGVKGIEYVVNGNLWNISICIQRSYDADEVHTQFFIDTIVALLVCTGDIGMFHGLAKTKMIETLFMCLKTKTDIPQGITTRELTEQQVLQLAVACQILNVPVAMIPGYGPVKLVSWKEIHYLGKNIATDIHNLAAFGCKITQSVSNQKIKERSGTLINKGIYIN